MANNNNNGPSASSSPAPPPSSAALLASWTTDSHCSYHGDSFAFRLGLSHDCHTLFDTSSFGLHRGKVTGLVGTNGCGKTSLSRVLESKQLPGFPFSLSVVYLASSGDRLVDNEQEPEIVLQMRPQEYLKVCLDQRLDVVQHEIDQLEAQLEDDPTMSEDIVERLSDLYDAFDHMKESAGREMQQLLVEELGFTPSHLEKPLSQLSSGWRYKVQLVSALLTHPDLLIVDEPSFLDTASTQWLVERLAHVARQENAMVLLVSHKEALLDKLCDEHILYINAANKTLTQYHCGYSTFRELYAAQVESSRKTMDGVDKKVAGADKNLQQLQNKLKKHEKHLNKITAQGEDRRFIKGKSKEHKQKADRVAASKLKQLKKQQAETEESLHQQALADRVKPIRIRGKVAASDLAVFEGVGVSYDGSSELVLEHIDLRLEPTDRVLLKGGNGAGKSSLIKTLLGELEPSVGIARRNGTSNKSLYFPQTALHDLVREHGSETATDFLHANHPNLTETRLRQHLGDFGLTRGTALRRIATLSAGQQVRLWLAHRLLEHSEVSLLVLDEISENVDVETRKSLVELVNSWEGAAIVVSHDHDFCRDFRPTQVWDLLGPRRGMLISYSDT